MKKISVLMVVLLAQVVFFNACGGGDSGDNGNGTVYKVGDVGPAGGWIFYVNPNAATDGWTYLEAAPSDMSTLLAWSNNTTNDVETYAGIGDGQDNTDAIIADASISSSAAKSCRSSTYGGKTDWFLPSQGELDQMYLEPIMRAKMSVGFYLSSTQDSDTTKAICIRFSDRLTGGSTKTTSVNVRAIRQF